MRDVRVFIHHWRDELLAADQVFAAEIKAALAMTGQNCLGRARSIIGHNRNILAHTLQLTNRIDRSWYCGLSAIEHPKSIKHDQVKLIRNRQKVFNIFCLFGHSITSNLWQTRRIVQIGLNCLLKIEPWAIDAHVRFS